MMLTEDFARRMNCNIVLPVLLLLLPVAVYAQTPTWSTKVAPILFDHCTACHHDGGVGPFSLTTYADAVANAGAIEQAVRTKKMPPWPPDAGYARLAHERILSDSEISLIRAWSQAGMLLGDPLLAPPTPVYHHGAAIPGTPDLVVRIPNYVSTAAANDVYQCFVIPGGLPADKFVRTFEAIPGNGTCVHHVLVFTDTTGRYAAKDNAYPGPGFPYFGGVTPDSSNALGIWVPGSTPMTMPPGFGVRIARNADIVVQIHYPAGTAGITDSTELHFFFAPDTGTREVVMQPVLTHEYNLVDGPLYIPANTEKQYFEEAMIPGTAMSLLGIFPHVHMVAKSLKSYGIRPAGDTDRYISIPDWKFHWQNFYMFPRIKKTLPGTLVRAEVVYDNTTDNSDNPNSPPADVWAGEKSTDEMMLFIFLMTPYRNGDEDIVIDVAPQTGVLHTHYNSGRQLLDVVPNPAMNDIVVKTFTEKADRKTITVTDMQGRIVRTFATGVPMAEGYGYDFFSVQGLPAGDYLLTLTTSAQVLVSKLVVITN